MFYGQLWIVNNKIMATAQAIRALADGRAKKAKNLSTGEILTASAVAWVNKANH